MSMTKVVNNGMKNNEYDDDKEDQMEELKVSSKQHMLFHFNLTMAKLDSILVRKAFIIIFLFIYISSLMLMFFWGFRDEYETSKNEWYVWYIVIARSFGYTLNFNSSLIILLGCKLLFTKLRNTQLNLLIPFDKIFPLFHIVVGYIMFISVLFHAAFHMIWVIGANKWNTSAIFQVTMSMVTGYTLLFILLLLFVLSLPYFRTNFFVSFYFIHNVSALLFFAVLFVHGVYNGKLYTYKWITAPLVIYLADRLIRNIKIKSCSLTLQDNSYSLKGRQVIKLSIPKPFEYRAGQYAEIKISSINKSEWHPFTIASAPEEQEMTFYIKALGDWTEALRTQLEMRVTGETDEPLRLSVRGPFGAPAQHADGYDHIILLSGGIGATPFVSVCKHIYYKIQQQHKLDINGESPPVEGINIEEEDDDEEDEDEGVNTFNAVSPVKTAKLQLSRGINYAYYKGGAVTDYETWNFAQSTSHVALASPRNNITRSDSGRWASSPIMSEPHLSAGRTPKRLTIQMMKRNKSSTAGYGLRSKSYSNKRTFELSPTTFKDSDNGNYPTPNSIMPTTSTLSTDRPWSPTSKYSHEKNNQTTTPLSSNSLFSKADNNSNVEDVSKHEVDLELSVDDFNSQYEKEEDSFPAQTMNINDATTAAIVRNRAELKLRVRTLRFFHSVTMNMMVCILTILRIIMVVYMELFYGYYLSSNIMKFPGMKSNLFSLTIIDVILGITISLILLISLALELSLLGKKFFSDIGRTIDLFVLLSVSCFSLFIPLYSLLRDPDAISNATIVLHFAVLLLGSTILMFYRLYRIIGHRVLIANRFKDEHFQKLKSVEFLWTSPTSKDDDWIRDELGNLAANGKKLRLHRYLTRTKKEDMIEDGEDTNTRGMKTNLGRPNWSEVFSDIAERTASDGKVGIFFCGPHPMASSIKKALKTVQVKTILRGVYLGTSQDDAIKKDLRLDSDQEVEMLRLKGSNIQFVFREENFG